MVNRLSDSRPWWQECTDETFRERIAEMPDRDLHELVNEQSALIAKVEAARQVGSPDADWMRRVRVAIGHMTARRKLVRAELSQRCTGNRTANYYRRKAIVDRARRFVSSGDLAGAIAVLIDSMDPDLPLPLEGTTQPTPAADTLEREIRKAGG